VPLHNQFIKALLRNAYSAVPSFVAPAQPAGSLNFKREASDATATGPSKRLKTKAAATPGSSSIVRTRMPPRRPSPVVRQFGSGASLLALLVVLFVHASAPSRPPATDAEPLWVYIALIVGTPQPNVQNSSRVWPLRHHPGCCQPLDTRHGGKIMIPCRALGRWTSHKRGHFPSQHHLKDILAMCKRARKTSDLTTTSSSTPAASVFHQPEGDTITARDLLTMVQNRPYLLGEDLPVNQERILIMQEDY